MGLALERLHDAIASAGIPIDGVKTSPDGGYLVDFRPEATVFQRDQAEFILDSFDPSPEADLAWLASRERMAAGGLISSGGAVPIATRASMLEIHDQLNEIRRFVGMPSRSMAEVLASIRNRIAAGAPLQP
jgi:hypothetical protein